MNINCMTLSEAREYTRSISDYHSLDIRIPGVVCICVGDHPMDNLAFAMLPVDGLKDAWYYPETTLEVWLTDLCDPMLKLVGVGEDLVVCNIIQQ